MTRRKAAAGAAVGHAEGPVRDVARGAAELGERRRAAGQAHHLQERDQADGDEGRHDPPDSHRPRRRARERQRPPDVDHEHAAEQPRRPAGAVVEHPGGEPLVVPGKAVGVAEQARDRQVEAGQVPRDDRGETGQQDGDVAPQAAIDALPPRARGRPYRSRHAERKTKYTAPTRHRPAQRKSSLSGCFMKTSANGTKTSSVITSCVIFSCARLMPDS